MVAMAGGRPPHVTIGKANAALENTLEVALRLLKNDVIPRQAELDSPPDACLCRSGLLFAVIVLRVELPPSAVRALLLG